MDSIPDEILCQIFEIVEGTLPPLSISLVCHRFRYWLVLKIDFRLHLIFHLAASAPSRITRSF